MMAGLASRLADRGHAVTLITLDDGGADRHAVDERVHRVFLDVMSESRTLRQRIVASRRRQSAIGDVIDETNPDVILSFCDRINLLVLAALRGLGWWDRRKHRSREAPPVVVAERTDPKQQSLGPPGDWLRRRLYRSAYAVIALTDASASYLRSLGCGNVRVIPSAVDRPPLLSNRSVAEANRRFVGVGRLEPEKGFDRLLDAFARVVRVHPDWQLRIVGEGRQARALKLRAKELRIGGEVSFPGWVSPIWDELAAATVFVLPSRYEGFPSALLEAMAVGVPSVAMDCESGPRAIIDDRRNGLLAENTSDALAATMKQMIDDAALRESLGVTAQRVVEQFGWEPMVDAYERTLQAAAESGRPRST